MWLIDAHLDLVSMQHKMRMESKLALAFVVVVVVFKCCFLLFMIIDRAIFVGSVAPWQAPVEAEVEE